MIGPPKERRFAHRLQETAPAHTERVRGAPPGSRAPLRSPPCSPTPTPKPQRNHRPPPGSRPAHPRRRTSLARALSRRIPLPRSAPRPVPEQQLQCPRWEQSAPPPTFIGGSRVTTLQTLLNGLVFSAVSHCSRKPRRLRPAPDMGAHLILRHFGHTLLPYDYCPLISVTERASKSPLALHLPTLQESDVSGHPSFPTPGRPQQRP